MMRRQHRNLLTLGTIGVGVGLFAILGVVQTQKSSQTVAIAQEVSNSQEGFPVIGGAFDLVDRDGKAWKDTDFRGKLMLVYFGYTFCPDICPMALHHMTKAMEKLGGAKVVQPIFITIDPHRDTSASLQTYAQNFHKDFIMLTGSQEQVNQAIKAYKVHAARASEEEGNEDYFMNHSSLIYLMDKNGKYLTHFNHQTSSSEIVKKIKLYMGR